MKVVLIALGTRGDVQPITAFAIGLSSAGFDVRVATHEPFRQLVTNAGLEFASLRFDIRSFLSGGEGQDWLEAGDSARRAIFQFRRAMTPHLPGLFDDLRAATADADVVLGTSTGVLESTIADAARARFVIGAVMPMMPTRTYPNINVFPSSRFPKPINGLTHTVADQVVWHLFRKELQEFRRSAGIAPLPLWGPYRKMLRERTLVLNAVSPRVAPRASDWPEWVHTTGYWRYDDPLDHGDLHDLQAFLDAGPPPVYAGFGSMTPRNASGLTDIVVGALRKNGQRGILMTGWGGLDSGSGQVADDLFVVDRVSHQWLFPRMLATIHHGGSGTTGASISAGVPSVIVPFLGDQRYWGSRVAHLGVGPKPMQVQGLTVDKLADALRFATSEPVRQRAAALGREVSAETGVANAVEIFTRYVS